MPNKRKRGRRSRILKAYGGEENVLPQKSKVIFIAKTSPSSEVLPAQLMETGAVRMEEGEITLYEKFWQGDEMPAVLV